SGPGCSSTGAAPTDFSASSGSWKGTSGGVSGYGCKGPKYRVHTGTTRWDSTADWVFTPRTGFSGRTLAIHITKGTSATIAEYEVYSTDSSTDGGTAPFDSFTVNQHTYDDGGWYRTGRFSFSTGTIDLALTNAGPTGHYGVVADVVEATC